MPRLVEETKIWFELPDDPDGGRVLIRNLTDMDRATIMGKAMKNRFVFDPQEAKVVQEQGFDILVDRLETIAMAVVDWEKFFDQDAQPMDCTDENKKKWACNQMFVSFVKDKLPVVAAEAARRSEEKRKNS